MQVLYVSYNAIKKIVGHRKLQSIEFEESTMLVNFLRGEGEKNILHEIYFNKINEWGYIFTKECDFKKGLVFDLTSFLAFKKDSFRNDQIITIFQKVLKYSVRFWEKLPLTTCERNFSRTNFSAVYPLPFTPGKSYKVVIDKNPDEKRLKKRLGEYLLVFNDGYGNNIPLSPSYRNFRRILENPPKIDNNLFTKEATGEKISAINITALDSKATDFSIDANIGFDNWQYYLTDKQKEFILKDTNGPERLEGAAGTGKTLTLILRCIYTLMQKSNSDEAINLLFVTHSIATKRQIERIFLTNYPEVELFFDRNYSPISITITTLQEWCLNNLNLGLGETEYLDIDAQDSKILQILYLEESFNEALKEHFESYKPFCSNSFITFIENTPKSELLEMLQQEVAVTIKGRAGQEIEKYRQLPRLVNAIPAKGEGDLNFLYLVYEIYQRKIAATGQFDSDDIVLSSIGPLNTPIWKRRRKTEGYDIIFIDETHLFNFNELSIFHHLVKVNEKPNIIFAIDKSQAIGDKGLTDPALFESLGLKGLDASSQLKFNTVFRSSPEIINLAFNILMSGSTLFTNFENPLDRVESSFTEAEERKAISPRYILKENDSEIIKTAFKEAEEMVKKLGVLRSKVLIVACCPNLLTSLTHYAEKHNKPCELLKNRGDLELVKSAEKKNCYVLGGIDFIGGLEFECTIIVGVDKGRVPPSNANSDSESYQFLNHSWHNRMYVAITRAKYSVIMLGDLTRGESNLLESSIKCEIVKME